MKLGGWRRRRKPLFSRSSVLPPGISEAGNAASLAGRDAADFPTPGLPWRTSRTSTTTSRSTCPRPCGKPGW
eukprot:1920259-Pyramimonas_sp.AAC.1